MTGIETDSATAVTVSGGDAEWEKRYIEGETAICAYLSPQLQDDHRPPPSDDSTDNYHFYFYRNNQIEYFYFDQKDIGVSYRELLLRCGVPSELLDSHPSAASETNRCFFLHLGLATGLNPFLLQRCFRREARRLLSENQETIQQAVAEAEAALAAELATENPSAADVAARQALEDRATQLVLSTPDYLYEPVLRCSEYVDMDVLTRIWPRELADVRICLVPVDYYSRLDTIIVYTPENSVHNDRHNNSWTGKDVILKKELNHFTYLAVSPAPTDPAKLCWYDPQDYSYYYNSRDRRICRRNVPDGHEPLIDRFLGYMRAHDKVVALQSVTINDNLSIAV